MSEYKTKGQEDCADCEWIADETDGETCGECRTNKILNTSSFMLVKKSKQQEGGASRLRCEAHRRVRPQTWAAGRRLKLTYPVVGIEWERIRQLKGIKNGWYDFKT